MAVPPVCQAKSSVSNFSYYLTHSELPNVFSLTPPQKKTKKKNPECSGILEQIKLYTLERLCRNCLHMLI